MSGIRVPDCFKLAINWKNDNDVTIFRHNLIVNFFMLFCFSYKFYLMVQVSCQYHHWFSLELWQFYFIRDWPEIWKLEIQPSEFCPIFRDWGKLGIPNLTQMFLIKSYWMLQNTRVAVFTVSELLMENQLGVKLPIPPPPPSTPRLVLRSC